MWVITPSYHMLWVFKWCYYILYMCFVIEYHCNKFCLSWLVLTLVIDNSRFLLILGHAYLQPMMYGRGPTPSGLAMMPMLLPDGRIGYVL